jgi:hypothetical protein
MDELDKSLEVAIGDLDGEVIVTFSRPVQWWPIEPESARQIAEQLARSAYKAHTGLKPLNEKSYVSETARKGLQVRAEHIIRSMIKDNKKPKLIAYNVVDQILKEVT